MSGLVIAATATTPQPKENPMSLVLDAMSTVHTKQIDAVTKSGDLVVKATEKAASTVEGLRAKAPQAPAAVSGPLARITAPVAKVVGTPADFASYFAQSTRDWAAVQQKLTNATLDALAR
jgi:hypothetical protein